MSVRVRRLPGNPIIGRDSSPSLGANVNGPSLIAAPPWLEQPLGRQYLYFAHHRGTHIRLATAPELSGPWSVYEPGSLSLAESLFPTGGNRRLEPPESERPVGVGAPIGSPRRARRLRWFRPGWRVAVSVSSFPSGR